MLNIVFGHAFLSENDARNTPKITDIDELTQKLKTLSEEIEVRVNELSESPRAADNGVEELSASTSDDGTVAGALRAAGGDGAIPRIPSLKEGDERGCG